MEDLEEELNEIAGHLNAQHARLAVLTRELLDQPSAWASDGIWTVEQYLCWRTGISSAHARQLADIARRADELPACMEAFERGELSLDQATVLARKVPSWADVAATDLAKMLTVSQLRRSVGKYEFPHIPEPTSVASDTESNPGESADEATIIGPSIPDGHGASPEPPAPQSTCGAGCCGHTEPIDRCSFGVHDDGRFRLTLETDRVRGEIIEQALLESRDALFNDGQVDVTWVDAFSEICDRSLDAVASPERRNRFRINMHLDVDGRLSNATGHFLPDAIRRYITCDGLLTPVLVDNGIPISMGRSQHIVPDRTRRVVIHRDGGCGVPGCGSSKFLEVHHIIHWEHDGVTETWNLIALCPHHHRLHHQGKLGIAGNADVPGGVVFTDGNGKQILASGARPRPPGAPPSPPVGRYQHPLGERLDLTMVHFSPPTQSSRMSATSTPQRTANASTTNS